MVTAMDIRTSIEEPLIDKKQELVQKMCEVLPINGMTDEFVRMQLSSPFSTLLKQELISAIIFAIEEKEVQAELLELWISYNMLLQVRANTYIEEENFRIQLEEIAPIHESTVIKQQQDALLSLLMETEKNNALENYLDGYQQVLPQMVEYEKYRRLAYAYRVKSITLEHAQIRLTDQEFLKKIHPSRTEIGPNGLLRMKDTEEKEFIKGCEEIANDAFETMQNMPDKVVVLDKHAKFKQDALKAGVIDEEQAAMTECDIVKSAHLAQIKSLQAPTELDAFESTRELANEEEYKAIAKDIFRKRYNKEPEDDDPVYKFHVREVKLENERAQLKISEKDLAGTKKTGKLIDHANTFEDKKRNEIDQELMKPGNKRDIEKINRMLKEGIIEHKNTVENAMSKLGQNKPPALRWKMDKNQTSLMDTTSEIDAENQPRKP